MFATLDPGKNHQQETWLTELVRLPDHSLFTVCMQDNIGLTSKYLCVNIMMPCWQTCCCSFSKNTALCLSCLWLHHTKITFTNQVTKARDVSRWSERLLCWVDFQLDTKIYRKRAVEDNNRNYFYSAQHSLLSTNMPVKNLYNILLCDGLSLFFLRWFHDGTASSVGCGTLKASREIKQFIFIDTRPQCHDYDHVELLYCQQ